MPFIDVGGAALHVREWGSGPLAVLVHGFGSDHRLWGEVAPRLQGRRCVAVDLRGCGSSAPASGCLLSMGEMAEDLQRLVHGLGADSADFAGFSMGGFAVLALWERHPEVIRSLALVSARANADSPEQRAGRDRLIALALQGGRERLCNAFLPLTTAASADGIVKARLRTMFEAWPYETLVRALRGMRDREDRMALMGTLSVPTLVVVGDEDALVPMDLARDMVARAPSARLAVIPGAGHSLPLEAPEPLAAELRKLWSR